MIDLIIGRGEIGSALENVLSTKHEVVSYDLSDVEMPDLDSVNIMHICIPYTEEFVSSVNQYMRIYRPKICIVHSSVLVGTCSNLSGSVIMHSPVRGTHPDMVEGLKTYIKYLSYDPIKYPHYLQEVVEYFESVGIRIKEIAHTRTTELMKLLELCRYGTYIAFAKEQEKICDKFDCSYDVVVSDYERSRNEGITDLGRKELCQPVLYPFKDYVGGHCTVEDMELMLQQIDMPLLREAYRIDRATVTWPNSNIYKTAKIGKGCSIGQFCEIGHNVQIGNNVRIGAFTFIPEGVTIEDDVFIAPRVSFSNDKHPPAGKESWGKVVIKKGAVIGMGAIILPGVTVGENAVVGAGAIVTKDIPQDHVWYGNPAHDHGKRDDVYKA